MTGLCGGEGLDADADEPAAVMTVLVGVGHEGIEGRRLGW